MAKTREGDAAEATAIDPQNFPPYDLNADQAQAVHGRLADVDATYAPPGSDQAAQAVARPPASGGTLREGEDDIEAQAEAAKQANIDAGAAGSGDDTTGRVVKVPEPDGGLETSEDMPDGESGPEAEPETEGEAEAEQQPADDAADDEGEAEDDVESLTVAELQAELDEKNVEYDKYARKAELVEAVRKVRGC